MGQTAHAAAVQKQVSVCRCTPRYVFTKLSSDTARGFPRIKPGFTGKGHVFCSSFPGQIPNIDHH